MPKFLGYDRYKDDPQLIGCPRAASDMTPCMVRDGAVALADDGVCVGCGCDPKEELEKVRAAADIKPVSPTPGPDYFAENLRTIVRRLTAPEEVI